MNEITLIGYTMDGEEVYTISKDSHSHRNDLIRRS